MDVDAIRADFPVFRHRAYLDTACYAPACVKVASAVRDWWESALLISATSFEQTFAWLQPVVEARAEAAKLLHATEEEVAFITSTALGMSKFANSLPLERGDNIVINDLEFPSNTVPWLAQRRRGVEVRRVQHRGGKLHLSDFEKIVDRRTRVIAVSSVQWTTGFRCDLKALVELAEVHGACVAVDSMQSLGALELDVRQTGIHFMATQGHKWLFAPFGTGILFCRQDLVERLQPWDVETGNLVKNPARQPYHHQPLLDNVADYDLGFVPTAARLQTCPNIPGLWGLRESLKYINRLGIANIEQRVHYLVDYLLQGLKGVAGITVVSPLEPEHRSSIVLATTGSVEGDVSLMGRLSQSGVGVSVRYQAGCGGVRISCHFYNNEEDLDKLLFVVKGQTRAFYFH